MPLIIGTSGWHYQHWRPRFYPPKMGPSRWLDFYSQRFATVEVNNAFYRLPERSTFEHWRTTVPADFVVAVKASRYLTHVKRLREPAEPVARLMDRVRGLEEKLGPILLQFPPTLQADPGALDAVLEQFGPDVKIAVEPRHASWFSRDVRRILRDRGAALCLADGGVVDVPLWRTVGWTYVRFHRGLSRPPSCYSRAALQDWARTLTRRWGKSDDVYCYFNNDPNGCALRDARWMAEAFQEAGWAVTRVPPPRETRVG
jgi:uncharacterized protein YecE (DUF72 family)